MSVRQRLSSRLVGLRWYLVVAALLAVRAAAGGQMIHPGPDASAVFEATCTALSLSIAVGAAFKFLASGDHRFLWLAAGLTAYGGLYSLSVVAGLVSPSGYENAPSAAVVEMLGDGALLGWSVGLFGCVLGLSIDWQRLALGTGIFLAGVYALTLSPESALPVVHIAIALASFAVAIGAITRMLAGHGPRRLRPWLMAVAAIMVATSIPFPGVRGMAWDHHSVSIEELYLLIAISILNNGMLSVLLANFRQLVTLTGDLTKANERLVGQTADLRRAMQARGVFLGMVSHELRTPLNAILGFSHLLVAGEDCSPVQRRQLGRIREGATRLTERVEDILALTSAGSRPEDDTLTSIDAQALLEPYARLGAAAAAAKGLEFHSEFESAPLTGGHEPLGRVLAKIVGNAVRFSAKGRVSVRGQVLGEHYLVSVADQGLGIPLDLQGRLFGSFNQAEEGSRRRFGGLGLGLAVAQRLTEGMGGTIGLTSELGVGSTFVIEVPSGPVVMPPYSLPASPEAETHQAARGRLEK